MNAMHWPTLMARLLRPSVTHAVVVQCGLDWLRPQHAGLRNDIDQALVAAQLRRGSSLRLTRVVLHNLPAATVDAPDADAVMRAFDEWNYRLAATGALLSGPAPRVHRLIIPGDQAAAPLPDMVDLLEDGQWSDPESTALALSTVETTGATTPLTGYDVDLQGPFSDGDPSVHM
ncbi:hypothetical protein AB0M87_06550 [Streptomyces sp. NPDC051320]|uniref:hypothetical protein n=1 Tax=Streptomyces sp. NPDC051320 TaxID=3154644 RepID=UPI00342DF775